MIPQVITNNMHIRTASLALLALCAGCNASYYQETLSSQIPRQDGTTLDVQCVSHIKHDLSLVSSELQPQPQVTITLDERIFVVRADEVVLNDEPYAALPDDIKQVHIEVTADGFEVTADGQPIGDAIPAPDA
ncbi:MAG: hypothetical protein MI861_13355 [Pirellulales bacterium]|nr:hypothetical protein [Pirellulales bacterium]